MTMTIPPAGAHAQDRARQRLLALAIQIGIRLVEHDQEWIAVKRARERDALALSGRQGRSTLADIGVVAFRQTQDLCRARRPR